MKVIILAAGQGTRLWKYTREKSLNDTITDIALIGHEPSISESLKYLNINYIIFNYDIPPLQFALKLFLIFL